MESGTALGAGSDGVETRVHNRAVVGGRRQGAGEAAWGRAFLLCSRRLFNDGIAGNSKVLATPHKVLDGVEPDRPQAHGVLDGAADVVEPKALEEPQHLHVLARARLAQPRL